MKKLLHAFGLIFAFQASIAFCQGTRVDEIPMYGGQDRSVIPELKAADETLIADTTKHYGSREEAASAFVSQGFRFHGQGQLGMAMRRFNQAWLLDPTNPEVYWGFGAVLNDQSKMCESMAQFEKALSFNRYFTGLYPDAGSAIALCAISSEKLTPPERDSLFIKSESLYSEAAEKDMNKGYVFYSWAIVDFHRQRYAEAWEKVRKARGLGAQIPPPFIRALSNKMREP